MYSFLKGLVVLISKNFCHVFLKSGQRLKIVFLVATNWKYLFLLSRITYIKIIQTKLFENNITDEFGYYNFHIPFWLFSKHMRDVLPHATFIGFTGTPV